MIKKDIIHLSGVTLAYLIYNGYFSTKGNHLRTAMRNIPDPSKDNRPLGEDAWIETENLIAVADGVGSWTRRGHDAGIFARELCAHFVERFNMRKSETLVEILSESVKETVATGTSTFVACELDSKEPILRTINLGDSGYRIFRQGSLLYRSTEQQHRFNAPF